MNDREILDHAGKISAEMAKELAQEVDEKYHQKQIQTEDAQEMKILENEIIKMNKAQR